MITEKIPIELQLANLLVDNTSCCGSEADKVIPMILSLLNHKPCIIPGIGKEFRELAEKVYTEIAFEIIRLAGENEDEAKKIIESMKMRGFDNEDLQLIPILEKALWRAYNHNL